MYTVKIKANIGVFDITESGEEEEKMAEKCKQCKR